MEISTVGAHRACLFSSLPVHADRFSLSGRGQSRLGATQNLREAVRYQQPNSQHLRTDKGVMAQNQELGY
jgi:hypothetical protein